MPPDAPRAPSHRLRRQVDAQQIARMQRQLHALAVTLTDFHRDGMRPHSKESSSKNKP